MVWHAVPQNTVEFVYSQAEVIPTKTAMIRITITTIGKIFMITELSGVGEKKFFTPRQKLFAITSS
jgi:hypothetical protein